MGAVTDDIQAIGALVGTPAALFTAVMLYLQLRDRRLYWLPGIEVSVSLPKRKNSLDPAFAPPPQERGTIDVRFINETQKTILFNSIAIRSPDNLRLLNVDVPVIHLNLGRDIPPGETLLNIPVLVSRASSGKEASMTFKVSLKSLKTREKRIVVKSIIT